MHLCTYFRVIFENAHIFYFYDKKYLVVDKNACPYLSFQAIIWQFAPYNFKGVQVKTMQEWCFLSQSRFKFGLDVAW